MKTLIDSYKPTIESSLYSNSSTTNTIHFEQRAHSSTRLTQSRFEQSLTNSRILNLLDEIALLQDNWDGDGAKAPDSNAMQAVRAIIHTMNSMGQSIFHIAPGPLGEIMLDFRNKNKSFELIFYPDKWKYVTFSETEISKQGIFDIESFSELLSWLNKD